jgi:hypothetical protein
MDENIKSVTLEISKAAAAAATNAAQILGLPYKPATV